MPQPSGFSPALGLSHSRGAALWLYSNPFSNHLHVDITVTPKLQVESRYHTSLVRVSQEAAADKSSMDAYCQEIPGAEVFIARTDVIWIPGRVAYFQLR
jgi:hypothetical protein